MSDQPTITLTDNSEEISILLNDSGDEITVALNEAARGPAGSAVISQSTPPGDHGLIWFDTETATFSVWHVDAWVSVVSSGGSTDAASIILALGLPSYASLTAANAALAIGQPYYDTTLAQIQIATA